MISRRKALLGASLLAFLVSTALPCLPESIEPHGDGPTWRLHVDHDRLSPTANCRPDAPAHDFLEAQCRCGCTRDDRMVARAGISPLGSLLEEEPANPEIREPSPGAPEVEPPATWPAGIDHVPLSVSV